MIRPALMVEFGSWEGRSAITFCYQAKQLGLQFRIICVDTWLGSSEHWQNRMPDTEWSFARLKVRDGEPHILETFRETIENHGFVEETSIVRAPTSFAAPFLKRTRLEPELVYIDADHSFGAVLEDLRLAASIMRAGGVIAGDDFRWQSVRLAVRRFATKGSTVMTSGDRTQFVVLNSTQGYIKQSFLDHQWRVERFILIRELPLLFMRRVVRPIRVKVFDPLYRAGRIPDLKMRFRGEKL